MAETGREVIRKFAVFDIDGTLIRWQLYHAVVESLAKAGDIDEPTHQKIREARMSWKRRENREGFSNYENILVQEYERALQSLDPKKFDRVVDEVIDEYKDQTYTYTRDLIKELKQQNYILLAISGSQTELVAKIADYYKFDDYIATRYSRNEKGFDGKVVVGSKDKAKTLEKLVKKHDLTFDDSYAVGDSKSDAPMLGMVEHAIAFNPDKVLFNLATKHHWKIVIERKNMIYELEEKDGTYLLA